MFSKGKASHALNSDTTPKRSGLFLKLTTRAHQYEGCPISEIGHCVTCAPCLTSALVCDIRIRLCEFEGFDSERLMGDGLQDSPVGI